MDRHDAKRVHHPDPVLLPQPVPKRRPEQGHQDQEAGRVGFGIGVGRVELFFFVCFWQDGLLHRKGSLVMRGKREITFIANGWRGGLELG